MEDAFWQNEATEPWRSVIWQNEPNQAVASFIAHCACAKQSKYWAIYFGMCLVNIRTAALLIVGPASNRSNAICSIAFRWAGNCACLAVLKVPLTPASSSIAASLI
jgi:hypothetical protein